MLMTLVENKYPVHEHKSGSGLVPNSHYTGDALLLEKKNTTKDIKYKKEEEER